MAAERIRQRMMRDLYNEADLAMQTDPRFGKPEYPVGTTFQSREECVSAGVHALHFAGIHGTNRLGAFSICLSGGYEDDKDEGHFFKYAGTGGQSDSFSSGGRQVADQTFDHPHNSALKKSVETKRPVRVVRGPNDKSKYAPAEGYRYDGLYVVEKAYLDKGVSGYEICRYELRRVPGQPPLPIKW
ncbi:hypothetical protein K443DRAFT_682892 [Laccaria amethystina LaAM-08-1]|uniref:YDG domain-containing protein n=1 Tax=Laccaria amethystina LaAM-08-1 TaxID=1095629 RepID=A0A0C9XHK5_9AGAR|nr:hypothetical protein K443DRAFT_682892 [Laccaria amethystina LaAM-08-1]